MRSKTQTSSKPVRCDNVTGMAPAASARPGLFFQR